MAGIIPVAGLETDFNQRLPEVMMPVDAGFTAIQKSVYECAMVGCRCQDIKMGIARKVLRFLSVVSIRFTIAAYASLRDCLKGRELFSFLRWQNS